MARSYAPKFVFAFALGIFGGCSGDSGGPTPLIDHGSCPALIECAANLAPEARDAYEQAYGPGGTCWSNINAWSACKDFCRTTLEALNLVAMATGDSCGTCSTDADCASFGAGAHCDNGFCAGGSGSNADGETGEEGSGPDSNDTSTDTNDTNTDTNDTNTDTDTDGCSPVHQQCEDLLACLAVVLPDVDTTKFEAGGSCWCGTTQEADECVDLCIDQLESAAQTYPNVPACAGEVDPCPNGTEGCECGYRGAGFLDCHDNLLCDDNDGTCVPPEFGECYGDDPLCPPTGCPNGYAYYDKDDDGQPDFAACKFSCDEEFGFGECTDIALDPSYTGDVECIWGDFFNWNNGLMCAGLCDSDYDCPDASVCVNSICWYDLP